jgi:HK97 family phage prohead protease
MERAYATLQIKSVATSADGKRTFTGIASTPSLDRQGDIVEPSGAQFTLPIPFLWQHDSKQPIGWINKATVTAQGIAVEGEVADIPEEGSLKDKLTEAWQYIKNKLVRGLSIGFDPIERRKIDGASGYRYTKWNFLELSAVTIPANQDASITSIKRFDRAQIANPSADTEPDVMEQIAAWEYAERLTADAIGSAKEKEKLFEMLVKDKAKELAAARVKQAHDGTAPGKAVSDNCRERNLRASEAANKAGEPRVQQRGLVNQNKGFYRTGDTYEHGDIAFVPSGKSEGIAFFCVSQKTKSMPEPNSAWRVGMRIPWKKGDICKAGELAMYSQDHTICQIWKCLRSTSDAPGHNESWQLVHENAREL